MCSIDTVKELVLLTNAHNLTEIEIHHDMTRIRIKKNGIRDFTSSRVQESLDSSLSRLVQLQIQDSGLKIHEITSPMVGTFYRALSPGSKPYVDIGAEVNPETVVCVIETMKIINEIKANVTGKVVEVLVEDGEAVEFGQPLFRVLS